MNEDEYLASEPRSVQKRELVNGQLVAMAGPSLAHNTIAANLVASLHARLRGKGDRSGHKPL